MNYFYITMQVTFGILSPVIIVLLLVMATHAVTAWAEQKKWDAHYENPKDPHNKPAGAKEQQHGR